MNANIHLEAISEHLLLSIKMDQPYEHLVEQLVNIHINDFNEKLVTDHQKKVFWINIYNAYFILFRKHEKVSKPFIYSYKEINVAGQKLSLDDIEHGILRRFRLKISLGYLPNIFAPFLIKKWAVAKLDYRIHFALNCGAVSCPPIAFYQVEKIDQQLDMATKSFLENETTINHESKTINTTKLFQWYKADFGGTTGIKKLLSEIFEENLNTYKLGYTDYDFTEQLDNFVE